MKKYMFRRLLIGEALFPGDEWAYVLGPTSPECKWHWVVMGGHDRTVAQALAFAYRRRLKNIYEKVFS
jgi:hypothetical protein